MKKACLAKTLLIAGLSCILCGCGSSDTRSAGEFMHVDDLWTVTDYIEKTTRDAQIPENCIRFLDDTPFMACVDGRLFGRNASGMLNLDADYLIRSANFFTTEISYDELLEQFTMLYGEPVARGENPNVEIAGSVATWHKFNTGKYIVTLSKASGYDYIENRTKA